MKCDVGSKPLKVAFPDYSVSNTLMWQIIHSLLVTPINGTPILS
jgi:hypothetical protein